MLEEFFQGSSTSGNAKSQFDEMILVMRIEFKNLAGRDVDVERMMFLVQVTRKMIQIGEELGVELDLLIPDIQAMFPGFRGTALVNMIRSRDKLEIQESSRRSLKRCAEVSEGISPSKLTKLS